MSILSRAFTHITIPAEIWLRKDISMQAKCLWAELRSLHDKEVGGCYASEEYLCEFMQLNRRRLYYLFSELKDAGLLETVSFDGRRTIRKAIVPEVNYDNAQQECTKVHTSSAQKCTPVEHETALPTYIYNKEKNKEEKSPPSPKGGVSELSSGLSSLLFEKIKLLNSKHKPPNIEAWAKIIDLMIRVDKRDPKEIRKIIEWLPTNEFWRKNILSTEKLRSQFDKLIIEMAEEDMKKQKTQPTKTKTDNLKKNKDYAEVVFKKVQSKLNTGFPEIILRDSAVELRDGRDVSYLGYTENGFVEQLLNFLRKKDLL